MAAPVRAPSSASSALAARCAAIVDNVERVVHGKRAVVEMAVVAMLAEGHLLVEDVPGVGKTSLAKALAASVAGSWGRIQCTPDLLPADVVGVTVWNRATGAFEFRPGPVFANVVLADELNRASPKTQSALLEAMEERQVTVDRVTHALAPPFMVIATQNPIEHEGTHPLPESQVDRFLLRVSVGYPARGAELAILDAHGSSDPLAQLGEVVSTRELRAMVEAVRAVHVAPAVQAYLVDLAEASRRHPALRLGLSPRATLGLQRAARARAALAGRAYVVPDDVKALAPAVMGHRLLLAPSASLQRVEVDAVVEDILRAVPAPGGG